MNKLDLAQAPKGTPDLKTLQATAILTFAVLFGCGGPGTTPNAAPEIAGGENAASSAITPLADTQWRLVEIQSMEAAVGFSKEPDASIEKAILRAAPDYTRAVTEIGGANGQARYIYNLVDLNGDGSQETLVYLLGSILCGSGGCNLYLFRLEQEEYTLVNNFPISRLPVIVSPRKTNGWHDLVRPESGGGAPSSYVVHAFESKHYAERQRLPGNVAPEGKRYLAGEFTFQDGIPLEFTK